MTVIKFTSTTWTNESGITAKQYKYLLFLMELLNYDDVEIWRKEWSEKFGRLIEFPTQLSKKEASELISNLVEAAKDLDLLTFLKEEEEPF